MEMKMQSGKLKVGDKFLVIGKNTGVVEGVAEQIMIDEKFIEVAEKGQIITIPLKVRVRDKDKVYLVKNRDLSNEAV